MDDQNTPEKARKNQEVAGNPLVTFNPLSGKELKRYPQDTPMAVDLLVNNTHETFFHWRAKSLEHRADIMRSVAADIRSKVDNLSRLMAIEMGKPVTQGRAEIEKCAWLCEYYTDTASHHLADVIIETDATKSFVRFDPLGVVLGIMPWNYPFWQVFRFAVPTLMAGNTVLLKHSTQTTGCAIELQNIFVRNGVPSNGFTTLKLAGAYMDQVIGHKLVRGVSLTGSEAAGSHVASLASKLIKPTLLELGGSNPFIILADADIEVAANAAIAGRFGNTGQSCIAAKRMFVQSEVYDSFIEIFIAGVRDLKVGDPLSEETFVGPMANEELAVNLEKQLISSLGMGAKLHCGGQRAGAMFEPTVVSEVRPGMALFDEETFGPVASVTRVFGLDEAIRLGNKSNFGLGVSVFTSNHHAVLERCGDFEDGALFINSIVKSDPRLPFGGTKNSGYGRELAGEGIRAFTNKKTIYVS